jgi:hypothetical protein
MATGQVQYDKPEQLQRIQDGLLSGEEVVAVYDCTGAGTGFVGITNRRIILQDNSFIGKKVALTSIPYNRVQAVSFVSNKSMLGKFASSSNVAISVGGAQHECEFRGHEKARFMHDFILHHIMG